MGFDTSSGSGDGGEGGAALVLVLALALAAAAAAGEVTAPAAWAAAKQLRSQTPLRNAIRQKSAQDVH